MMGLGSFQILLEKKYIYLVHQKLKDEEKKKKKRKKSLKELHTNPDPSNAASIIPAIKAPQFKPDISFGTDIYLDITGSLSEIISKGEKRISTCYHKYPCLEIRFIPKVT